MKHVVMGVTGSIAAYKACDIISALRKSGVDVHVILTHAGAEIITPLTLETISGNRVVKDMFDSDRHFEFEHISPSLRICFSWPRLPRISLVRWRPA